MRIKRIGFAVPVIVFIVTSGCSRKDRILKEGDFEDWKNEKYELMQNSMDKEKEGEKELEKGYHRQEDREGTEGTHKGETELKKDEKEVKDTKKGAKYDLFEEARIKAMEEARELRESKISNINGTSMGVSIKYDDEIRDEFAFAPNTLEQTTQCYEAALSYLREELNTEPKTKMELYVCYDKAILRVYQDEDRGYLKDYSPENIYVWEYQKDNGDWSFIFMGREDKTSDWKVVYSGETYK